MSLQRSYRYFVLMVFLVLLVGCASGGSQRSLTDASGSQGVPSIMLTETSYNFGTMTPEGTYEHEFIMKNGGTGVLEVKYIKPG